MHGAPAQCIRCGVVQVHLWAKLSRRTHVGEGGRFALTFCCCCSGDDYLLSGLSLINYCATYKYYRKSEKIYRSIWRLFKLLLVQISTKLRGCLVKLPVAARKYQWAGGLMQRQQRSSRSSSNSSSSSNNSSAAAEAVATAVAAVASMRVLAASIASASIIPHTLTDLGKIINSIKQFALSQS